VTIGHVTFDWEPSTPAGIAAVSGVRGTDLRLANVGRAYRPTAAERKSAKRARRGLEGGEPEPGDQGPGVPPGPDRDADEYEDE
jgi:GTP-binding protein